MSEPDVFDIIATGFEKKEMELEKLKKRLEEATALLNEAVDKYMIEADPKLWSSRVREWLKE